MNLNFYLTKDYENETLGERGKNEPKTNPNKAKCKKAQMNVSAVLTKNYNEKWTMEGFAKQSQIKPKQTQIKANFYTKKLAHCL